MGKDRKLLYIFELWSDKSRWSLERYVRQNWKMQGNWSQQDHLVRS